jgi:hypothetical protein
MINAPLPINSPYSAKGFYGIQQSELKPFAPNNTSNLQTNKVLAGIGVGLSLTSSILNGINILNSVNGLNSQIEDLKKVQNLKIEQLNTALNQQKSVSSKQATQLISQQASDVTKSGIDLSSSVFLTAINEVEVNKMNKDFIADTNVTIEKLNTLFDTKNQMENIFNIQQGMVAQGFNNFLSAGLGLFNLASLA